MDSYICLEVIIYQLKFMQMKRLFCRPIDLTNVTITTHFSEQAGTKMAAYCSAIGPSALTFSWKRNHVTLKPSYWVKIKQHNSTCSVLTIRMMGKADSGNYTCNVRLEDKRVSSLLSASYKYYHHHHYSCINMNLLLRYSGRIVKHCLV